MKWKTKTQQRKIKATKRYFFQKINPIDKISSQTDEEKREVTSLMKTLLKE